MTIAALMCGCGKKADNAADTSNTNSANIISAVNGLAVSVNKGGGVAASGNTAVSENASVSDDEINPADIRYITCIEESFVNSLDYIKDMPEDLYVNYQQEKYLPVKRENDRADLDIWKGIQDKTADDYVKKVRFLREDKAGSTLDVICFIDKNSRIIDKIITEEFCADGRDITEFYFIQGRLNFCYQYKTNIYDATLRTGDLPGKKCYFVEDYMAECYLNDADVNYTNVSYIAADYNKLDEFTRTQYDQLEKDVLNRAYITYEAVREIPGTAVINGYVGDEFGGVLSNVQMTITSKANQYSEEFTTNGDGYFEIRVPVNEADNYGIVCKYGSFTEATVDDIAIHEGMISYSLGVIYMAEPGQNIHEPNTYLLNANYQSPVAIGNDELCIVMTYEDLNSALEAYGVDLIKDKASRDSIMVIKNNADTEFKYYVTDVRGGHSGNPMTYEMSTSRAVVKVYSNKGLIASYQVPVNSAGTVWEVFGISNGKLFAINNYFYENTLDPFFN